MLDWGIRKTPYSFPAEWELGYTQNEQRKGEVTVTKA